jgi:hypothetical protein
MNGGLDQGFTLNYWNLSYRRRMLRDLWLILAAVLIALGYWRYRGGSLGNYWPVAVIVAIGIASAAYNYRRWKSAGAKNLQEKPT